MPILDVEIVTGSKESLEDGLARKLADIAGDILGSAVGGTWVKLRALPREYYAENADTSVDLRPIFVSILMSKNPSAETMGHQAEELSRSFGMACDRPKENVHVLYQVAAAGRVAFGGELVKR